MAAAVALVPIIACPFIFIFVAGLLGLPVALEKGGSEIAVARCAHWLAERTPLDFRSALYVVMFAPAVAAAYALRRLGSLRVLREMSSSLKSGESTR